MIPLVIGALGTVPKGLLTDSKRVETQMTSRDLLNCSIGDVDQNTEKSPGELKIPTAAQTPTNAGVKNIIYSLRVFHINVS